MENTKVTKKAPPKKIVAQESKEKEVNNMEPTITRTIDTVVISGGIVGYDDKKGMVVEDVEATFYNVKVDDKKAALKLLKKTYGKDHQYIVKDIKRESDIYSITVSKFLANSEIIKRPPSQTKK